MKCSSYIPTRKELLRKQALLNIQNFDDNYCILYVILAHIHPLNREGHPSRHQKHIKFMSELNYEWSEFLLKITDVPKLEMMNPDISINILFYENRIQFPLYNSPHRNRKHHVNLLLIMDEKNSTSHYLLIRSLSRLGGSRTNHNGATHVCPYCLHCLQRNMIWRPTYQNGVFMLLSVWNIRHPNTITTLNTKSWRSETLPKLCLFL